MRQIIVNVAVVASALAAVMAGPGGAQAQEELRILTWEGYADDAWVKPFEEANDVTVSRTYVGSNDEYMAKLAAGGGDYDLVVIVSSLAEPAISAGFVEPLNLDLIPNYEQIFPRFQTVSFNRKEDAVYGVPTFWGVTPVTVNAEVIPERADFGLLFDPKYKGRIAMWDDVSTIGDVAAWMGFDDIWNLNDEELDAVKQKLLEQKPLIRTYWSQAGEAIDLFLNKEIVASNSWSYITQALRDQNFPAREFASEEPLGFVDSHFVVEGSDNAELAHKFIDHMIAAETQAKIGEVTGYKITNPQSKKFMPPEVWQRLDMETGTDVLEKIHFWENIPRRAAYLAVLNEVKAGIAQ
jgi:spermidine/putrescine-binding protein